MDRLPLAAGFVEAFCAAQGVAPPDALRLTLIVEELFTNTIVHGHGGDHASPVRIEVAVDPASWRCATRTAPRLSTRCSTCRHAARPGSAVDERRSAAWACRWWRKWSSASTTCMWTASTA